MWSTNAFPLPSHSPHTNSLTCTVSSHSPTHYHIVTYMTLYSHCTTVLLYIVTNYASPVAQHVKSACTYTHIHTPTCTHMRAAYIDMTNENNTCPQGLTYTVVSSTRMCTISHTGYYDCSSVTFPRHGVPYTVEELEDTSTILHLHSVVSTIKVRPLWTVPMCQVCL